MGCIGRSRCSLASLECFVWHVTMMEPPSIASRLAGAPTTGRAETTAADSRVWEMPQPPRETFTPQNTSPRERLKSSTTAVKGRTALADGLFSLSDGCCMRINPCIDSPGLRKKTHRLHGLCYSRCFRVLRSQL